MPPRTVIKPVRNRYNTMRRFLRPSAGNRANLRRGACKLSKENLFRTAAYVTVFSVAEKFFGFLYRIILSRTLGAEGMGLYQLALSVFAVLVTATSSGIPLTVSRLITKHRTRGNKRGEYASVTAAIVCVLAFSLPVFCLLFFGHGLFGFLFSDPRCMALLLILLPALTFNSVYSVLRGALWGNKKFIPYCVIDLVEELCMIGMGVVLVHGMTSVFDGAKRIAFAIVFSYLVSFTLASIYFFAKGGRFADPRPQLKPLLSSALPITGMRTSSSLINSAISLLLPARLIAAGMLPEEAMRGIGVVMGMSMPVLSIPATLIGSLALVMVPELAENYFRGNHKRLRDNIEKALKLTSLIACAIIPALFALGEDVGVLLFGSAECGRIIRNGCLMLLPSSLAMITTSILNSVGFEKQTCGYFFIGAAATLLCTWFLPAYIGVYAQIAGAAAGAVISCLLNLRLIAKKSKEKVRFAKHTLLSAVSILPACLLGGMLRNVFAAVMPLFPAVLLTGLILLGADALFLFSLGLAEPRWAKALVRRA